MNDFVIRNARQEEFNLVGELMVTVYSNLSGFPGPDVQPSYYDMLRNVGALTQKPDTELLVAAAENGVIGGAVVYFSDMKYYGSGGSATKETNASGFRLLAVDPQLRGHGIGKQLAKACIEKAKEKTHKQVIIHTTEAMQTAWKMYEAMGFRRSEDLDFVQGALPVFGFRLML